MRRGKRTGGNRQRGVLAHPPDAIRSSPPAVTAGTVMAAGASTAGPRGRGLHILPGNGPLGPAPGQRRQIHSQILGQLPHRRLSQRPVHAPSALTPRSLTQPADSRVLPEPVQPRTHLPLSPLTRPPCGRPQLHPVPDQHRLPLDLRRRAPLDPRLARAPPRAEKARGLPQAPRRWVAGAVPAGVEPAGTAPCGPGPPATPASPRHVDRNDRRPHVHASDPSGTSRSVTTPSNGQGSSTSDFAVSISTMTWLTVTESPGFTFQETMSASVSPSPTSGSLNCFTSAMSSPRLRTRTRGRRRRAPGPGRAGSDPPAGTAGTGWRTRRPAGPGPPGGRSTPG